VIPLCTARSGAVRDQATKRSSVSDVFMSHAPDFVTRLVFDNLPGSEPLFNRKLVLSVNKHSSDAPHW
jgi:hypothetical protein